MLGDGDHPSGSLDLLSGLDQSVLSPSDSEFRHRSPPDYIPVTMKATLVLGSALSVAAALPNLSVGRRATNGSLVLDQAPDTIQPYVLRKGSGRAVQVGSQVYRFSVTGNSSAGAFTLMQTNAHEATSIGVLPHIHKTHYENFYCSKGRMQLWAKTNATGEAARVLTAGD